MKSMSPRSHSSGNTAPKGGGAQLAGAKKAVLLPFSLGQGRAEERVLVAQQPYPAEHGLFRIHIGGNGLPHGTARTGIVGNGRSSTVTLPPLKKAV